MTAHGHFTERKLVQPEQIEGQWVLGGQCAAHYMSECAASTPRQGHLPTIRCGFPLLVSRARSGTKHVTKLFTGLFVVCTARPCRKLPICFLSCGLRSGRALDTRVEANFVCKVQRLQLSSTQSNETVKKRCRVTTNQVTRNPGRLDRPAVRCPGVSEKAPAACKRCPRRAARDRKFRHAVLIIGFSSDRVSEVCCPRPRNSNTKKHSKPCSVSDTGAHADFGHVVRNRSNSDGSS